MISDKAWCYAKVLRHQLENAAARCAREQREGALTEEQAQAILEPLRLAIAAAGVAEKAPPPKRAAGPDVEIRGMPLAEPEPEPAPAPAPDPTNLQEAWALYGVPYGVG